MQQPINQKSSVILTPDELAALEVGIRSEATEEIHTLEESIEFARKRRKAWMKTPESRSA